VTATISPTAADRRQLAQVLLDRSGLELNPRVDRDQVLALLARVLDRYDPPRNEHGALVVRSLIPHSGPGPVRRSRSNASSAPAGHRPRGPWPVSSGRPRRPTARGRPGWPGFAPGR
jgi:hypothetical protein